MNGVTSGVEFDSLILARQEARGPLARSDRLRITPTDAGKNNEAREIFSRSTEAVGGPGSHGGTTTDGSACVHESVSRIVIDLFRDHGADHSNVVSESGSVGQVVTDVLSALAVALELTLVTEDFEFFSLELSDGLPFGERLGHCFPVECVELRLVVEGF